MRIFGTYPKVHYEPVHQPRMKVFTVGLDDKEKSQKAAEAQKEDMTKIPIDSSMSTPAASPGPIIISRGPPKHVKGCGVLTWIVAAFLVVLLCLTVSEIAYNRQRDQAFLRLKWAELRQRMLGYELLSQAQNNNNQNVPQPPAVIDERLAFSNRRGLNEAIPEVLPLKETPTIGTPPDISKNLDNSHESGEETDMRFGFLRQLLEGMRRKAEELGLNGDMQVHVIEVKPLGNNGGMDENRRAFQDGFGEVAMPKQNFGPHPHEEDYDNWETMRQQMPPPPPPVPAWELERPFPFPPRHRFPEFEQPFMGPSTFDNFPRQPQGPFFFADAPPERREFFAPPPPQRMPWPQQQPQWVQPWNQVQQQQQNQWQQPQPQWNNQWNQESSVGQQNQFPFPAQNQLPIVFAQQQQQQQQQFQQQPQQPWYMPEEPKWNNDWQKQDNMPMQPHPAAAQIQWVDRTAGEENQGIDNFEKQERFNGPAIDVAMDEEPSEVTKPDFKVNSWQHTQPKSAEDIPASAPVVSSDAVVSSNKADFLPIREDPLRNVQSDSAHSGEQILHVQQPAGIQNLHDDAVELSKKFNSPFFQIDDPNSFRH